MLEIIFGLHSSLRLSVYLFVSFLTSDFSLAVSTPAKKLKLMENLTSLSRSIYLCKFYVLHDLHMYMYVIDHSPRGFSGSMNNTLRGTLADCFHGANSKWQTSRNLKYSKRVNSSEIDQDKQNKTLVRRKRITTET